MIIMNFNNIIDNKMNDIVLNSDFLKELNYEVGVILK